MSEKSPYKEIGLGRKDADARHVKRRLNPGFDLPPADYLVPWGHRWSNTVFRKGRPAFFENLNGLRKCVRCGLPAFIADGQPCSKK